MSDHTLPSWALMPLVHSPFQAKFCGHFTELHRVTDQNYILSTPNCRKTTQLCHVNLLKPYYCRKPTCVYPLPSVEDCIAACSVSKFDLLKGYWQIPLTARAKKISTVITPSGLYAYTVMSFGLRNAPATFQWLMNLVVSGLEGCAVYLDDLVIYSDTWEEHLARINSLLVRLSEARPLST